MPKRKASFTYAARKRARGDGFKRPRGRYGRSFRKRGTRFPTYKFHRYATSINTYSATSDLLAGSLPFTLYPINEPANKSSFPYSMAFTLADVGNLTEFTSLFDRYMITGVKVYFHLLTNPNVDVQQAGVGAVPTIQVYPRIWYAIDNDDAALTTLSQLKEYGNVKCRVLQHNRPLSVYVPYPRVSTDVHQTSGAVAAGVGKPMWLDCGYPNVNHYGMKFAIDFGSCTAEGDVNTFRVKLELKYYFKCKDVR